MGDDDEHCTGKNNTGTKEMEKGPPTRKETDEPEAEREEKEKRLVREALKPTDDVFFSSVFSSSSLRFVFLVFIMTVVGGFLFCVSFL